MTTTISTTVLILSVMILSASCTTVNETTPTRQGQTTPTARRGSMAEPYYQDNPDGSYYQSTEEGDNANYRAGVKRSNPSL